MHISTHTPLAGRHSCQERSSNEKLKFQLTRPSRGATLWQKVADAPLRVSTHTPLAGRHNPVPIKAFGLPNFNSHAPCGVPPRWTDRKSSTGSISTHTPLAGRHYPIEYDADYAQDISTHTPILGNIKCLGQNFNSHAQPEPLPFMPRYFNSHAPRGAPHNASRICRKFAKFQLTRPTWGATCIIQGNVLTSTFQLTRPMWAPHHVVGSSDLAHLFQLTRPTWDAT